MDVIQEPPIKRKRGVVNPSKYQRNRIKSSRSQGKEARSYYHFVKINGKNVKVCLKAFLSIHAVSKQRVQRIKLLLCNNETPEDKRGKNVKSNLMGEQYREEIREHISSKRVAVAEKIVHQRRAKKFYSTLKTTTEECQQREDLAAFCFDFMQNLQLPEFPTQDKFYLSQLTVSLFCITNLKTQKSFFYIYHEGQAAKGPNEKDRNSKVQFTVSKFHHLVYEEDNVVKASEYINGFMWNTFTDLLQPRTSTSCLQLPTEKAYKGPLPIGTVKLDNIKTLLRWVEEEHKEYYHNILLNHPPKDEKVKKNKK
ncbi:hypothetical protein RN001_007808 [Aquatica leii]|uniref:Uncharacterized protein n=1 Tax=Aquatica leii TaxID=1421715 RepID=A0AAN7SFR4_9COLE|nr:hypothetical protein RN001_007808 [Aquatica leii]